jgi:hypothetical protein
MLHFSSLTRLGFVALLAALLAGCASTGRELPAATYGDGSVVPSEEYTIGPLDEITIHVWAPAPTQQCLFPRPRPRSTAAACRQLAGSISG